MPVIHARFGEYDHGDENGPNGFSICVSRMGFEEEDRHHLLVVDESRFGGEVGLVYTKVCDLSCCEVPKGYGVAIGQMLLDPEHKPIALPEE